MRKELFNTENQKINARSNTLQTVGGTPVFMKSAKGAYLVLLSVLPPTTIFFAVVGVPPTTKRLFSNPEFTFD